MRNMEERALICNYKKCRKSVKTVAYVTACSHVFCDEDGTREFKKATVCPACQMDLSSKFDIVRNNLQPSEQYKSMILAGLKPEIVIEICMRAISFWLYQCQQEKRYHEFTANKAKDRLNQLEQYYEQILSRTTSELQNMKLQLAEAKKEHDETKRRYDELSDKLTERNSQHKKLQILYDSLRRKFIAMSNFDESSQFSESTGPEELASTPANFPRGTPRKLEFPVVADLAQEPANHVQTKFNIGLGTPRQ